MKVPFFRNWKLIGAIVFWMSLVMCAGALFWDFGRWSGLVAGVGCLAVSAFIVEAREQRKIVVSALHDARQFSVSQWRSAPDVKEYARQALSAPEYVATPLEMQLGGILVAAGLPVSRECEYKVIVRVKGDG